MSPRRAALLAVPRGLGRVLSAVARYWSGSDLPDGVTPDRRVAEVKRRHEQVLTLARWAAVGVPVALAVSSALVAHQLGTGWAATLRAEAVLLGAAVLAWLAWAGWDGDLTDNLPAAPGEVGQVSEGKIRAVVAEAVGVADWQAVTVHGQGLTWDEGRRWWSITLRLPGVKGYADAARHAARIAAGLDVGESRLILDPDPGNHGIVTLRGTMSDPWAGDPVPSPLLTRGTVSVWDPIPFGVDAMGRLVEVSLPYTGWVIGARPRRGKTFAMRLLGMAAALDVHARLDVWDFKGGSDWRAFQPLAQACGWGPSDATVEAFRARLVDLKAELERRAEVIGGLPVERCPESKVTRELAADPDLGLAVLVVLVDEVHVATEHPRHGKEVVQLLADIVRGGPAFGVVLVLATQRPAVTSIPAVVRDQLGTRMALHVPTLETSRTILGTTDYRADKLPAVAGVGLLYGADDSSLIDGAVTMRAHFADGAQVAEVCRRAETLRRQAGTMPGQDAPPPPPEVARMADVIRLHGEPYAGETWALSEDIAARLGMDPVTLAEVVRPWGLASRRWGEHRRWGYALGDVERVLDGRREPARPRPAARSAPRSAGRSRGRSAPVQQALLAEG